MNSVEILALAKTIVALGTPAAQSASRGLSRITVKIPALGEFPVNLEGDYVYLHSLITSYPYPDLGSIEIKPDGGTGMVISEANEGRIFPVPYRKISIKNLSAAYEATIDISVGFGRVQNDAGADVVNVGARLVQNTFNVTRPANVTAYTAGDAVGTAFLSQFSIVAIFQEGVSSGTITRARLLKSSATVANAAFRLYLFDQAPVANPVDNAQLALSYADTQKAVAVLDFPAFSVDGGGAAAFCELGALAVDIVCRLSTTNLVGILIATAAYVPASEEQFQLELTTAQN